MLVYNIDYLNASIYKFILEIVCFISESSNLSLNNYD
jgi:hypothetical protein